MTETVFLRSCITHQWRAGRMPPLMYRGDRRSTGRRRPAGLTLCEEGLACCPARLVRTSHGRPSCPSSIGSPVGQRRSKARSSGGGSELKERRTAGSADRARPSCPLTMISLGRLSEGSSTPATKAQPPGGQNGLHGESNSPVQGTSRCEPQSRSSTRSSPSP